MKNSNLLLLSIFFASLCVSCSDSKQKESTDATSESILQESEYDSLGITGSIFDIPEITVSPSPASTQSLVLSNDETVIDYDISPAGPIIAALVKGSSKYSIKFWKAGQDKFSDSCEISGYTASAIAWHPRANSLFLVAEKNNESHVLRIEKKKDGWAIKNIFSSQNQLRRLVLCPRPFIVGRDNSGKERKNYFSYRLFLGMKNPDNSYRVVSITETGTRLYQVVGPKESFTHFADEDVPPSDMTAQWALPTAFHPGGHELIWEDNNRNFFVAEYQRRFWGVSKPFSKNIFRNGTITPTPNGIGLLHWQKDKPGIGMFILPENKEEVQLSGYQFISTPSSVPDGKGIVGLTQSDGKYVLHYLPVNVPLASVVNAWMYSASAEELRLLNKNYGLFRPDNGSQLYQLYDTENYDCGSYDANSPTRPYLVTTDIFWELFGAAYEGLFIVKERDKAIPAFWNFIHAANEHYKKSNSKSKWPLVFSAISEFNAGNSQRPEVQRIQNAEGVMHSDILGDDYNYSELKPRGHYTSSDEMKKYFKAFKYFTTILEEDSKIMEELNSLPSDVKQFAEQWITSYLGFISPPRSPLVWKNIKYSTPAYTQYPEKNAKIFPLSWGFDNEVLYSTVYHERFPADKQITGPQGDRILPSGLDIASVLGNNFAETLLDADYKKYPPLKNVIAGLKENFQKKGKASNKSENLYDKWITALAVQWADTVGSPCRGVDKGIWDVKRLQTGLASWATLRHATALVNERTAAECGEGGFEEILMRAPRGYVEPDPYTFSKIAELFETAVKYVSEDLSTNKDISDQNDENGSLYEGIVRRLKEAAKEAREFQVIAEKEISGKEITNDEYLKILYTGRVAEHYFLIFKSLANKDYALSTPDPIGKIADVAGDGPYLMSAVGNAMEWNQVVPYFGRNEIVKGSIYSYYEFSSEQLLDDKEWQDKIIKQEYLPWVKPYISQKSTTYPAATGY